MDIDDERLMALADGEITGDEATRLLARIDADADLAARYALFARTRSLTQEAALADPEAAVSDDLAARIRQMADAATQQTPQPEPQAATVLPLRRPAPRWQPMAIAASLALGIGLSAGLFLAPGPSQPDGPVLSADLRDRLGQLASGEMVALSDGRRLSMVASFTDAEGHFCREFETTTSGAPGYVSVACRNEAEWSLRFAVAVPAEADGFAPASSLETLDAFHVASGASQPLSAEAERAFLD